jgi:hypothetical protein
VTASTCCSRTTTEDLFTPAADNWGLESWLTQIAWMRTLGREGGLFFTIGRKDDLAEMRVRQLTRPRI